MAAPTVLPGPVDVDQFLRELDLNPGDPTRSADPDLDRAQTALKYQPNGVLSPAERDLLAILRERNVPFYRPSDIKTYKDAKVESKMGPLLRRREGLGRLFLLMCWTFTALSFLPILVSVSLPGVLNYAWILALAGVAAAAIAWLRASFVYSTTDAIWGRVKISKYRGEVPRPALNLAAMLKESYPNLKIRIDEFKVERYPLDPLLVVKLRGAEFCVAVWDEPGFDAPLLH